MKPGASRLLATARQSKKKYFLSAWPGAMTGPMEIKFCWGTQRLPFDSKFL
jgi:hypothetical protein